MVNYNIYIQATPASGAFLVEAHHLDSGCHETIHTEGLYFGAVMKAITMYNTLIAALSYFQYSSKRSHVSLYIPDALIVGQLKLKEECPRVKIIEKRVQVYELLARLEDYDIVDDVTHSTNSSAFRSLDMLISACSAKRSNITAYDKPRKECSISTPTVRPSWDEYYSRMALLTATRSSCLRRQVGAVLVLNNRVISTGYNGASSGITPCTTRGSCMRDMLGISSGTQLQLCYAVHAEENALLQCAITGQSSVGATMYVTHFPCSMCAKSLIQAGVTRIVYLEGYPDEFSKTLLGESTTPIIVDKFTLEPK